MMHYRTMWQIIEFDWKDGASGRATGKPGIQKAVGTGDTGFSY